MHLEPLEKLPRSVREFLAHYSMIVLSILTALALEQVALSLEHRHEGNRAKEEIESEIAVNRADVENSLRETRDNVALWQKLLARTVADVKAGQSTDETRLATLKQAVNNFRDSTPSLSTAAWDAAVASHAVDYLAHDELTRYSHLYAMQRSFTQALWDTVRDGALHSMADLTLPVYVGKADPVATIGVLSARTQALQVMASQLSQLDAALSDARAAPPAVAASGAASH